MGSWTFTIIENYCMYSTASKRIWKCTDTEGNKTNVRNKGYIPRWKRPVWCRKNNRKLLPKTRCGPFGCSCKFYASAEATPKIYKILDDGMRKNNE